MNTDKKNGGLIVNQGVKAASNLVSAGWDWWMEVWSQSTMPWSENEGAMVAALRRRADWMVGSLRWVIAAASCAEL